MAVTKTILKLTERDAVVKVAGSAGSATIDLQTDLKKSNEVLAQGKTQKVSIFGVQWTGTTDGLATIVRNGVTIMTLNCGAAGALEMTGQMMIPDNIEEASDLVVTLSGGAAEVWLRLRKEDGYQSMIETSEFSQYDNVNAVGS